MPRVRAALSLAFLVPPMLAPAGCWAIANLEDRPVGTPEDAGPKEGGPAADAQADADADTSPCNVVTPFGSIVNIQGLNTPENEYKASFTKDGLRAYVASDRANAGFKLYISTRATTATDFPTPVLLTGSTERITVGPALSSDERELFFAAGGAPLDIWAGVIVDGGVSGAGPVVGVNDPDAGVDEQAPYLVGNSLYFVSNRTGAFRIYRSGRNAGSFGTPEPVEGLGAMAFETNPVLTADEKTIYFTGSDSPSARPSSIYVATRDVPAGAFRSPTKAPGLDVAGAVQQPSWISPDGCLIVFTSSAALPNTKGGLDLYRAAKPR